MKKITLIIALITIVNASFSQTFMHGAGLGVLVTKSAGEGTALGEGLTYSPRINFIETEKISVSAGIPLTIGITSTVSTDIYANENVSVGLIVNAPLIINLNIGRGATKEIEDKFGYFVGAGFGFHHGDFVTSATTSGTASSNVYGPAANAGFRIGTGKQHKNIEVRFQYMKGLNETKPNVFGGACLFNF